MQDEARAATALRRLSQLGIRIAIDNFGAGLSPLLYLPRYPINTVKLDRAFVAGLGSNHDDEAISRSVINLAHAVQAVSIAQGVETQDQYANLRRMGCQQAQGFHWSAAVALADLPAALLAGMAVPTPLSSDPESTRKTARPRSAVMARILELHTAGASLQTIASLLSSETVSTPAGGSCAASVAGNLDA